MRSARLSRKNISQIAFETGFNSTSAFGRFLKSMRQYRPKGTEDNSIFKRNSVYDFRI
jgi:transcriptional regulator GlxA family with amidase domain